MTSYRLSQDAVINKNVYVNAVLSDAPYSIRATNLETEWMDTRDFERIFAVIQLAHTTVGDAISTLKLQQATSSAGAGAKDLTTSGAGSNYNTSNDSLSAADAMAILEARAEDMDQNNGFRYVRLYAASSANANATYVAKFMLMLHSSGHKARRLQGAYAAATQVYVTPQVASS